MLPWVGIGYWGAKNEEKLANDCAGLNLEGYDLISSTSTSPPLVSRLTLGRVVILGIKLTILSARHWF